MHLYEPRTTSNKLLARCNSYGEVIILLVKILLQMLFEVVNYDWILIGTLLVCGFFGFYVNWSNRAYYNKSILASVVVLNAIFFWSSLVLFILKCIENIDFSGGFIIWALGVPLVGILAIGSIKSDESLLLEMGSGSSIDADFEARLRTIILLLSNHKKCELSSYGLISYVHHHFQICPESDCPLKKVGNLHLNLIDVSKEKEAILQVIQRFFLNGLKHQNSIDLRIFYASFLVEYMNQWKKAMEELSIAQMTGPTFGQQFLIYRHKKIIEDKADKNKNGAENVSSSNTEIDIVGMIALESNCNTLIGCIKNLASFNRSLWTDLLGPVPLFHNMLSLGRKIKQVSDKVEENWQKLGNLNGANSLIIKLYSKYQAIIKLDLEKAQETKKMFCKQVKLTIKLSEKDFTDLRDIKMFQAFSVCSFNKKISGQFRKVNDLFLSMFNILGEDVQKYSIHQIVPEIYKLLIKKPQSVWMENLPNAIDYLGKEKSYFVKDINNWVFPVICSTCQFSGSGVTLTDNFYITSYKYIDIMEYSCIFLTNVYGRIMNVNKYAKMHFGTSPAIITANQINICSIFPEMLTDQNFRKTKSVKKIQNIHGFLMSWQVQIDPLFSKLKSPLTEKYYTIIENETVIGFEIRLTVLSEELQSLAKLQRSTSKIQLPGDNRDIWNFIKPILAMSENDKNRRQRSENQSLKILNDKEDTCSDFQIITKRLLNKKFINIFFEKHFYFGEEPCEMEERKENLNNSIFIKKLKKYDENVKNEKTIMKDNIIELIEQKKGNKTRYTLLPIVTFLLFLTNVGIILGIYSRQNYDLGDFYSQFSNLNENFWMMQKISTLTNAFYDQYFINLVSSSQIDAEYLEFVVPIEVLEKQVLDFMIKTFKSWSQNDINILKKSSFSGLYFGSENFFKTKVRRLQTDNIQVKSNDFDYLRDDSFAFVTKQPTAQDFEKLEKVYRKDSVAYSVPNDNSIVNQNFLDFSLPFPDFKNLKIVN